MTNILLTNDDGIDSPALAPFARALSKLGNVTVAVPSSERSWIGKAISRVGTIEARPVDRDGVRMWAVDGYPADCVHVGSFGILDTPPDLVVSGINVGANKGSAFASGSGTLGAAVEASNCGLAGIAFSAMSVGDWLEWVDWVHTADGVEMWDRLAGVAVDIAGAVLATGIPDGVDAVSVNFPADATLDTPRRVTGLARTSYGALFAGSNGQYHHAFDGVLSIDGDFDGSDFQLLDEGHVSITPVRFANAADLSDDVRTRWEN